MENGEFGFAEAESEACFTEARYDKDDPVHGCKGTKNLQPKDLIIHLRG